jgi:TDG/mug DNA glycosylase family protein
MWWTAAFARAAWIRRFAAPTRARCPQLVARLPRLRAIGCNGATAIKQARASLPGAPWPVQALPSSSPALASLRFEAKRAVWLAALGPFV